MDPHEDLEDCTCGDRTIDTRYGDNIWSCTNTLTCRHPNRCELTVIPGRNPVGKCVPEPRECACWGDPHCKTFDGIEAHFFGFGEFHMVQNVFSALPKIDVRVKTHAVGTSQPVFLEQACVDFETQNTHVPITICQKHDGTATIEFNSLISPLAATTRPVRGQYSYKIIGNTRYLVTWFGARFRFTVNNHNNCNVHLWLPAAYKTHTSGICGNYNDDSSDDYSVTIQRDGNAVADSEVLASVAVGDFEAVEFTCDRTTVMDICDEMFNAPWLEECRSLVDPSFDITTCSYDLCLFNDDVTKFELLNIYMTRCLAAQPANATSMCNWPAEAGLEPQCGENEVFNACSYECHDERTCYDELNDLAECGHEVEGDITRNTRHSKCVCQPGYFLEHGVCVHRDDCDTSPGEWGEWHEWGRCSEPCGGIAHRVRLCAGPNPCEGKHQDMMECHEGHSCGM